MKVLLVLPCMSLGGAQRVFIRLANGFAERGIDTLVYVFSWTGPLRGELDERRVRTIRFSTEPVSASLQARAALGLFSLLRKERPDAVVSTLYQTNMLVSAVHKMARSRARLVLREANFVSQEWPKSRFYPIARLAGPGLYRRAHRIVVPAVDQIQDICNTLGVRPEKVLHIGNPIVGRWALERSEEPLPESLSVRLQRPMVLAVGRMHDQKGFDVLIRAFARHHRQHGGQLVILGDGELRGALEQLAAQLGIAEAVLMPGTDTNPFRWFRRADLFVLSSRYEGLPNVLAQAMALGVRCISTDCPSGPRELLDDGRLGRLVPVDDEVAMAEAMSAALIDAPLALPAEWRARYDEKLIVEQYEKALFGTQAA
jgi:glycosyltransferase involved in cell wall biosynthesis